MSEAGETWRISENPPDGLNPFRWRLLGGGGRKTRPIAMFMHENDIERVVADHEAAMQLAQAPEASREQ